MRPFSSFDKIICLLPDTTTKLTSINANIDQVMHVKNDTHTALENADKYYKFDSAKEKNYP